MPSPQSYSHNFVAVLKKYPILQVQLLLIDESSKYFEISQKLQSLTPFTSEALIHPVILMQIFVTSHVPVAQTHLLLAFI